MLSATAAYRPQQFGQHPSQAMYLVDKIENDAHPFVIDAQVVLQVLNELSACAPSQLATKAPSSGSGCSGNVTFNFTNSSP